LYRSVWEVERHCHSVLTPCPPSGAFEGRMQVHCVTLGHEFPWQL